jgi:hypothetical protein
MGEFYSCELGITLLSLFSKVNRYIETMSVKTVWKRYKQERASLIAPWSKPCSVCHFDSLVLGEHAYTPQTNWVKPLELFCS